MTKLYSKCGYVTISLRELIISTYSYLQFYKDMNRKTDFEVSFWFKFNNVAVVVPAFGGFRGKKNGRIGKGG